MRRQVVSMISRAMRWLSTAEALKANAIEDATSASSRAVCCSDLKAFICWAVMGNDKRTLWNSLG